MIELPIEEIVWEDHFSLDGWANPNGKDIDQTIHVTSVGYRLKETKTRVTLVQNRGPEDVSGVMVILKKTIQSRKIVRE